MKLAIVEKKTFLAGLQCTLTSSCAKRGDPFDLLKIQFAAKYFKKLKRDPSETLKKFEIFEKRKMRILKQSHSAEKLERGDIFGLLKLQFAAKHQNT